MSNSDLAGSTLTDGQQQPEPPAVAAVNDETAEIDAIQVFKSLQCEQPGCTNVPSLGLEGANEPTRCSEHAQEEMLELVSLRCSSQSPESCNGKRTFGFSGGLASHCAKHQQDGMVDLLQRRNQVCIGHQPKLKEEFGIVSFGFGFGFGTLKFLGFDYSRCATCSIPPPRYCSHKAIP